MERVLKLNQQQKANAFYGSRASGQQLRFKIEDALDTNNHLTLDFSNIGVVTQSYIDEAVGVLILQFGPSILQRLSFKDCNKDVKSILSYVANTRSEDYKQKPPLAIH